MPYIEGIVTVNPCLIGLMKGSHIKDSYLKIVITRKYMMAEYYLAIFFQK